MYLAEILARYGKTYGWELKSRLMGCQAHEVSFKTFESFCSHVVRYLFFVCIKAAEILIRETGISMTADEYLSERNAKQVNLRLITVS